MEIETAYVNAYLEVTKDTLHEQLALILQLKTQLKNVSDIATERDRIIGEQNKIISELDGLLGEKEKTVRELANANAKLLHENDVATQKSAHIESCLKTVSEMKKLVQKKDATIDALEKKLNPSKKSINRKKTIVEEPVVEAKLPDDDF
jgi:predicted RNase H-like nuclease (RuvC/YqgF family)